MKIHDVTLTISSLLPIYPGNPDVRITRVHTIGKDHHSNLTKIEMGTHTGTHVDAPVHFIEGAAGTEALDISALIGPAAVIDATHEDIISAECLERLNIPEGIERILFRTRNSAMWKSSPHDFVPEFVGISADGAEWLVNKGIKVVGIDYLSIAPFKKAAPTHNTLLAASVIPIEGLDLSTVDAGMYFLICLPLKIEGSDGSPARVVLIEDFGTPS